MLASLRSSLLQGAGRMSEIFGTNSENETVELKGAVPDLIRQDSTSASESGSNVSGRASTEPWIGSSSPTIPSPPAHMATTTMVKIDAIETTSSEGTRCQTNDRALASRTPLFTFSFSGEAIEPLDCPEAMLPFRGRFEEFIRAVSEESEELGRQNWRLECHTRKRKATAVDLYFHNHEGRVYRSKDHFLRSFRDEKESKENDDDGGEEEEEEVIERRKPSIRVKTLKQKKWLENSKRVTRSKTAMAEKPSRTLSRYQRQVTRHDISDNDDGHEPKKRPRYATDIGSFVALIKKSRKILVVLGAGVSTAAGLPDFRTKTTGMYATLSKQFRDTMPPEVLFDGETFLEDPAPFYQFASKTFMPLLEKAKPTATHKFVSALAVNRKLLRCYTQNVDGLERMARLEEKYLIECHGTLRSGRCLKCGKRTTEPYWWAVKKKHNKGIPECPYTGCNGDLRPNMVFFGEQVPGTIDQRLTWDVDKCDLVLVIGTSLSVQPVSEIMSSVPEEVPRVWINRVLPPVDRDFAVVLSGDCDDFIAHAMNHFRY